jgi:hypothetical protein
MPLPPPKQRTAHGTYLYFAETGVLYIPARLPADSRGQFSKTAIESGGEYWTGGQEHDPWNWNWKLLALWQNSSEILFASGCVPAWRMPVAKEKSRNGLVEHDNKLAGKGLYGTFSNNNIEIVSVQFHGSISFKNISCSAQ